MADTSNATDTALHTPGRAGAAIVAVIRRIVWPKPSAAISHGRTVHGRPSRTGLHGSHRPRHRYGVSISYQPADRLTLQVLPPVMPALSPATSRPEDRLRPVSTNFPDSNNANRGWPPCSRHDGVAVPVDHCFGQLVSYQSVGGSIFSRFGITLGEPGSTG